MPPTTAPRTDRRLAVSVFKSVLLADLTIGNPTNFAGAARDAEGGKITHVGRSAGERHGPGDHEGSA